MASGSDKWIRSIKDNPAGKVVADSPAGSRWQWESEDETALQLKKLTNDDLAIEQTDIRPRPGPSPRSDKTKVAASTKAAAPRPIQPTKKAPARDAGGGFNPYDSGTPKRR
jgi:hypothetical protein